MRLAEVGEAKVDGGPLEIPGFVTPHAQNLLAFLKSLELDSAVRQPRHDFVRPP